MKRFLVFTYDNYYPGGGMDDFYGDFDTLEELRPKLKLDPPQGAFVLDSDGRWHDWSNVKIYDQVERKEYDIADILPKAPTT